mmetsp:Transcript_27358/g.63827  ORF Transcript_27358/g.63827 Transcript_27358/m.63827 type:complete len:115 (+) Transcript_27358:1560-1904(+)
MLLQALRRFLRNWDLEPANKAPAKPPVVANLKLEVELALEAVLADSVDPPTAAALKTLAPVRCEAIGKTAVAPRMLLGNAKDIISTHYLAKLFRLSALSLCVLYCTLWCLHQHS